MITDTEIVAHLVLRPRSTKMEGWVSSPDNRGTVDILWSCASTIFVCTWVMLHLNVPSRKDSHLKRFITATQMVRLSSLCSRTCDAVRWGPVGFSKKIGRVDVRDQYQHLDHRACLLCGQRRDSIVHWRRRPISHHGGAASISGPAKHNVDTEHIQG